MEQLLRLGVITKTIFGRSTMEIDAKNEPEPGYLDRNPWEIFQEHIR